MSFFRSAFCIAKTAAKNAVNMPEMMSMRFHTVTSWKTPENRISR